MTLRSNDALEKVLTSHNPLEGHHRPDRSLLEPWLQIGPAMGAGGYLRERSECETARPTSRHRGSQLGRAFQGQAVVDVMSHAPQLLAPLDGVVAPVAKVNQVIPTAIPHERVDTSHQPIGCADFDEFGNRERLAHREPGSGPTATGSPAPAQSLHDPAYSKGSGRPATTWASSV